MKLILKCLVTASIMAFTNLAFAETACPTPGADIQGLFNLIKTPAGTPMNIQAYLQKHLVAVDATNTDCEGPLHVALKAKNTQAFYFLYNFYGHPQINAPLIGSNIPNIFMYGLFYGDVGVIQFLQAQGGLLRGSGWPSFDSTSEEISEFMMIASHNALDVVKWAVQHYGSYYIKGTDSQHCNALTMAASTNSADVIRYLASLGLDIENIDDWGQTPIIGAAMDNNPDALRALIQSGARVNFQSRGNEMTALMWAADIGPTDRPGRAAYEKEMLQVLLDAGADKSIKDSEGKTAYDFALKANPNYAYMLRP